MVLATHLIFCKKQLADTVGAVMAAEVDDNHLGMHTV